MTSQQVCCFAGCKETALWTIKNRRYCIKHANIRQGFLEVEELL